MTSIDDPDDRVNILVVDDHPENVLALEAVLSRPEYNIVGVSSGGDALKAILKHEFAVILLDVLMPHMDGFETARLIRAREASRHIPIVFLTADGADVAMIYKGYSVGAVDYLIKPIDANIVKAKVSVFVDLFRKAQQIRRQQEELHEAERRRNREALEQSEAQYEATFNEAAVGIAHVALDGTWLRVNPRFCEIVGYTNDELVRLRLQDLTFADDLEGDLGALHRTSAGELGSFQRESRYVHKSGRVVWVNLTVSLLRDATGAAKNFIAILEDFSERKLVEERQRFLAAASDHLLSSLDYKATLERVVRLAVPALADACVIETFDPTTGETEVVNARNEDVSDVDLEEMRSSQRPDDERGSMTSVRDSLSVIVVPLVARARKLGTVMFIKGSPGATYADADLVVAEDLAQRIAFAIDNARLYNEAQEAIRVRDEFLSIASHELRTPITTLQMQLEVLLDGGDSDAFASIPTPRLRTMLQRAERQVHRLTSLIENLLDVSRITSGRLALSLEQVDLTELTQEIAGRFSEAIERAECKLDIQGNKGFVGNWDRFRLEQVVTNLLTNAIKYGAGKPVNILIVGGEDGARFEIRDQGIGIDADKLPRIFERFERAVSSQSYGGLGLGLYIARQIVEAHGGTIYATSEAGVGSVFTVELPLRVPASTEAARAPAVDGETARSTSPRTATSERDGARGASSNQGAPTN